MISCWQRWKSASALDDATGADADTLGYRDALARVHDGLRAGAADALAEPPAHLRPRIMAAIRSSSASQAAPVRASRRAPLAIAACAAALVAVLVATDPLELRSPSPLPSNAPPPQADARSPRARADGMPDLARSLESLRLSAFLAPAADVGTRVEQPLICELQNLRHDTSAAFGSLLGGLPAPLHGMLDRAREN